MTMTGKLPQMGENLGKAIRDFKMSNHETEEIDIAPKKHDETSTKWEAALETTARNKLTLHPGYPSVLVKFPPKPRLHFQAHSSS